MKAIGSVTLPLAREIHQVAIVVKDMWKTVQVYHEVLGWGPWNIYVCKPPRHTDTVVRGRLVHFTMQLAETQVGPVFFEVIEPLEGLSIYREFLEQKGEGLHHIACFNVDDLTGMLETFKRANVQVLMSGKIDGVRYCYMDTQPILKLIFETGDAGPATPDSTYP